MKDENQKPEDLKVRTKEFAHRVIRFYAALSKETVTQVLGKQVLWSGTSVGAHYRETLWANRHLRYYRQTNKR